jgi:hypothetical protein
MAQAETIRIADRFSRYPGGRYKGKSEFSGQEFRENILVPALSRVGKDYDKLIVELSGTAGYAMSFLEEAFGGLVRVHGYRPSELQAQLELRASDPRDTYFLQKALTFIKEARPLAAA